MRRSSSLIALIALALSALPARAVPPAAGGALASANVDLVATIPDATGIGARILGNTMYMTTLTGLRIYDVSRGIPVPQAVLPLPHAENENITVADRSDGKRIVLITADALIGFPNALFVIDATNPNVPLLTAVLRTPTGHTVTCVQGCWYAWSTGSGPGVAVVDLRDLAAPKTVGTFSADGYYLPTNPDGSNHGTRSGHNVDVDDAGIAWISGGSGLAAVDARPEVYGAAYGNLLRPPFIAYRGGRGSMPAWHNDFVIHNSRRPRAREMDTAKLSDARIDPGEVALVTEENWQATANGLCANDGQFQTGWIRTVDGAMQIDNVGRFKIGQGTVADAKKPLGVVACSSHWFDERNNIVADAWYEQGLRFLDVSDPRNIKQVGYFMPAATEVWMALFHEVTDGPAPGVYVYTQDLVRGLDVLLFNGKAGDAPALAPRYNTPSFVSAPSPRYGWACRLPGTRVATGL